MKLDTPLVCSVEKEKKEEQKKTFAQASWVFNWDHAFLFVCLFVLFSERKNNFSRDPDSVFLIAETF